MKKLLICVVSIFLAFGFVNSLAVAEKGYIEVTDQQMNTFLNQLDQKLKHRYSGLISQIRQAWMSRNMPLYDSLNRQLALTVARDFKITPPKDKPQPTGGCASIGGYNCYCGTSVWCCCMFPCNSSPINFCIGGDYGGIIGGGGGGGGGGVHEYICRPPQTKPDIKK